MRTDELDYALPESLIAQHPADQRDASRLMVIHRDSGDIALDTFHNIINYLAPGDCLVFNDTKVIRARLRGTKPTGGKAEIFLLHELEPGSWQALVKPSAKIAEGTIITMPSGLEATVRERLDGGTRRVSFAVTDVITALEEAGEVPLPPYIHRDTPDDHDLTRYQTVYANSPGAVAAPTAGLHYTPQLLEALDTKGIHRAQLTLHVGYGTFRPIMTDAVEDHTLEPEVFTVSEDAAQTINDARAAGGRIIAVGTTSTRVLESQGKDGTIQPGQGETGHYIHPPYTFRAIDAIQTNFHLPRSSLLALVYAFGGTDLMKRAYTTAIENNFRFYSYGDTMLII